MEGIRHNQVEESSHGDSCPCKNCADKFFMFMSTLLGQDDCCSQFPSENHMPRYDGNRGLAPDSNVANGTVNPAGFARVTSSTQTSDQDPSQIPSGVVLDTTCNPSGHVSDGKLATPSKCNPSQHHYKAIKPRCLLSSPGQDGCHSSEGFPSKNQMSLPNQSLVTGSNVRINSTALLEEVEAENNASDPTLDAVYERLPDITHLPPDEIRGQIPPIITVPVTDTSNRCSTKKNGLVSEGNQPEPLLCKQKNGNKDGKRWSCRKEALSGKDVCQRHYDANCKKRKTTDSPQEGEKSQVKTTQPSIHVMARRKGKEDDAPYVTFQIDLTTKVEDIKKQAGKLIQVQEFEEDERLKKGKFNMNFNLNGTKASLLTEGNLETAILAAESSDQPDQLILEIE